MTGCGSRWGSSTAETSTGVAPERPKSVRDFSCPQKISRGSSKFASSATSLFSTFPRNPRVVFRMPRRLVSLFFRSQKLNFHYKRSIWGGNWLFRRPMSSNLAHLPVVVCDLSIRRVGFTKRNFENWAFGRRSPSGFVVVGCFSSFWLFIPEGHLYFVFCFSRVLSRVRLD